jgi:hypothetical protein
VAGQVTNTLVNGTNSNIATQGLATLRLGGPTGAFSVGGFTWPMAGVVPAGFLLVVANTTTQPMSILHEDMGSTAGYRIDTQSNGAPVVLQPGKLGTATFMYDGTALRWRLHSIGATRPIVLDGRDYNMGPSVADNTTTFADLFTAAIQASQGVVLPPQTVPVGTSTDFPSVRVFGTPGTILNSSIGAGFTDFGVLEHLPDTIFTGALAADVTVGVNPTLSGVTQSGSGPAVTLTGVPDVPASWVVKITTGGALATSFFALSSDGGTTYGTPVATPSSGRYLIPGTSIEILFASGTYVLNTTYSWTATTQTVLLNWEPTVGNTLGITRADTNQFYIVKSVVSAGGGNYTVAVDRPFFIKWQNGDSATEMVPSEAPVFNGLDGSGMKITGTGSHALLMSGVWNATFRDIHVVTTNGIFSVAGIGFDGCMGISLERCTTDMNGSGNATGQYLEGCERSTISGGIARAGFYGFECSDSFESGTESCTAYNGVTGFNFITLNAAGVNYGGIDCHSTNDAAIGSSLGMLVQGQTGLTVTAFKANYCDAQGILVQAGPGGVPTLRNKFIGCDTTYCTRGVWIQTGCVDTSFTRLDVTGCGPDAGVWADTSCSISGLNADTITAGYCINATAGKHTYNDLHIVYGAATSIVAVALGGTLHRVNRAYIDISGTTSSVGILCAGGTTYLDGITVTGGGTTGVGLQILSGATVILGPNCDFSQCQYPIQLLSGGVLITNGSQGGLLPVSCTGGGNIQLTIPDAFYGIIEATGVLPSDTNIIIPIMTNEPLPGLEYSMANKTSGAHNLTFSGQGASGFIIASGKRAQGYIDASGNMQRLSPDT